MLTARPVDVEREVDVADPGPRPRRRPGLEPLAGVAGPAVAVTLALVLVRAVVGGRPPAGEDVMAHLIRADFALPHLVAHLRPDGWFPRLVLGQQEFLFNGPGLTWLVGAVRILTLGTLSTTGALKVVCVASVAALPPAVAFLARSYGLTRPAAGLAAVLSLLVSSPYGPGVQGLFRVGLVPNQVGAVLFCLALGAIVRTLDGPGRSGRSGPAGGSRWRRPGWPGLAAVAGAGLLVTHLISALILAVFVALTVAARAVAGRASWRGLGRLAAVAGGTSGLAAFWLVPLVAHRDLHGVYTGWDTPALATRLADVVTGRVLFPTGLGALVVAGWLYQVIRVAPGRRVLRPFSGPRTTHMGVSGPENRGRAALVWVLVPAAYLPVAYAGLHLLGPGDVTLQLPNRGLGYVGLMAVFAVAAPAAALAGRFGRAGHVTALLLAGVAVLAFAPGRNAPGQLPEPKPQLPAAAGALRELVPPGARFATQRDFPDEIGRTGIMHPETWLARVSGRNSLNGFNLEAVSTPDAALEPETLQGDDPSSSADRLARFGVTHVVVTDDPVAVRLAHSARFRPVWQASPITILAVEPGDGAPPPASLVGSPAPLSAFLLEARPEHFGVEVHGDHDARVSVAIAWSPKWHARLDGRGSSLRRAPDGLIEADVPAGDHQLHLDYRSDSWDRLGLGLTLLTLFAQLMSRIFSRTA
ncbi:MAG: hypothetical protein QOD57_3795 [Actinomycetota bacterium]|nr:hypothetical protein [Actinomycetota bacterium]